MQRQSEEATRPSRLLDERCADVERSEAGELSASPATRKPRRRSRIFGRLVLLSAQSAALPPANQNRSRVHGKRTAPRLTGKKRPRQEAKGIASHRRKEGKTERRNQCSSGSELYRAVNNAIPEWQPSRTALPLRRGVHLQKFEASGGSLLRIQERQLRNGRLSAGNWRIKCLLSVQGHPKLHAMWIGHHYSFDNLKFRWESAELAPALPKFPKH